MRKKLIEKYPGCIGVGDPPHALQLVVKDILTHEMYSDLVKQVNLVTDKFKNTRLKQFLKLMKVKSGNNRFSLLSGVLTRWGSTHKQMKKIFDSKHAILPVLADPDAQE